MVLEGGVLYNYLKISILVFFVATLFNKDSALAAIIYKDQIASFLSGQRIQMKSGKKIRLQGVLAPEIVFPKLSQAFVDYRNIYWQEYINKDVMVQDEDSRDRYGNLLADIAIKVNGAESKLLQEILVREGGVIMYPDNIDAEQYLRLGQLEAEARQNRQGIWDQDDIVISTSEAELKPDSYANSFRIVTGKVHAVAERKNYIYVNFGKDWKTDFTLRFNKKAQKTIGKEFIFALKGKTMEARGWLENYYGPMMDITSSGQIYYIND